MNEPPREKDLVNKRSTHENQDGPRDQKENEPYPHGVIARLFKLYLEPKKGRPLI